MDDFSLIILCREKRHLLPLTLDTLIPQAASFEVILLDGEGSGRLNEHIERYPQLKMRAINASGRTLPEMMNEGIRLSNGKYVQFLEPGDRYLSQHSLSFLTTLIDKKPHLVYGSSLSHRDITHDELIMARCPWYLRSKLLEIGGFDKKFSQLPALDLHCRLSRDTSLQTIACRRVLIDAPTAKIPLRETCKILYRHFGFWHAFKWVFVQDRSHLFQRLVRFLKEAFWKSD